MNIIDAIRDEHLFQPFLGELESWRAWQTALRCVYGMPVQSEFSKSLIKQCTGRDPKKLPEEGFDQALFLTGRRSGKSRIAAVLGAFEASLSGRESRLSKGEQGLVAVVSPTTKQSSIVKSYLRSIFDTPLLRNEVTDETKVSFTLRNGVQIQILAGDWRTVRGFTLLAAVVDEVCFMGLDSESHVKSDTELIRALLPALATCRGRLIGISSPYARMGWAYRQWKKNFGNDAGSTLVWNSPSRTMNPTLPKSLVDQALADDLASAKAEYLGEWRDDVGLFLPREVIEKLVKAGRVELMPRSETRYSAFVDVSGGRGDDSALAIAHREGQVIVLDYLRRWKSPHDPQMVLDAMSHELRRFGIRRVTGDNYSGEWCASSFRTRGIRYDKSELNKSELYLELLPKLCSNSVELLDDPVMVDQLAALERRTRVGGKDSIDHPPNGHDDLANAVAGAVQCCVTNRMRVGAL